MGSLNICFVCTVEEIFPSVMLLSFQVLSEEGDG